MVERIAPNSEIVSQSQADTNSYHRETVTFCDDLPCDNVLRSLDVWRSSATVLSWGAGVSPSKCDAIFHLEKQSLGIST